MACAQQLARAGHAVTLYERSDRVGGLLMYGIPDFKLEKRFVNRRVEQMKVEGVSSSPVAASAFDIHADEMRSKHDAIVLTIGSTKPRDLPIPGAISRESISRWTFCRSRTGATPATRSIRRHLDQCAKDKRVVILGGGDTGSDCLGTSNRQGAIAVSQFELLPMPPDKRTLEMPWPDWPMILRTSTSHEEGVRRDWSINTKRFSARTAR
jgi:glutamate synthase (NADPH/NADH) small chain